MSVAIVGASGFVGLRIAEQFLAESRDIRPLVRSASSLAVLARTKADWRICDFLSESTLSSAMEGCTACVHAAIGDANQIVEMATAAYRACAAANVPRLIWLSSASVHGLSPDPDTDETSLIHDRHPFPYNNAKVRAEWQLERLERDGKVEVIRLRPSIVYGPRSRWVADVAEDLLNGRAAWINDGRATCNAIYVDNLIEAIRLSLSVSEAAGQCFLLGDSESVTWREFCLPIAFSLGFTEKDFQSISPERSVFPREKTFSSFSVSKPYRSIAALLPDRAKRIVKGLAQSWRVPAIPLNPWRTDNTVKVGISAELASLQQCEWRLSFSKANRILGYSPQVSFRDGMRRSVQWLKFAGYPSTSTQSAPS